MTPLFPPAARFSPIRRRPFPVLAAVVCLLFAIQPKAAKAKNPANPTRRETRPTLTRPSPGR